MKGLGDSDLA